MNKNGFISMTIIYTFLLLLIFTLLTMLLLYFQKTELVNSMVNEAKTNLKATAISVQPNGKDYYVPTDESCFKLGDPSKGLGKTIMYYTCNYTEVVIPSTINGVNVEAIGAGYLIMIGSLSEYETNLTKIYTGNENYKNIFTASKSVDIKRRYTLMSFRQRNLSLVVIPEGITTIGEMAFQGNNIETLVLPESLKKIGAGAFQNNRLSELEFTNGLKEIGRYAFYNNNLVSVSIPASVTTIGDYAFNCGGESGGDNVYNYLNPIESIKLKTSIQANALKGKVCWANDENFIYD